MFVLLRKFLAMNITQTGGACSLIGQKWDWRWFYFTIEINSPAFLWFMQPTWWKFMKAWSYWWESLSMMYLSVSYVVISRLWHCYSEWNWGTQSTTVSYVSGTVGARRITKRTSLMPGKRNVVNAHVVLPEKIYLPPLHVKLGLMKKLCERYG